MVADVVEGNGCDEAVVHEAWDGWLCIEGVLPREAHQGGVALDPVIRCSLVTRVEHAGCF